LQVAREALKELPNPFLALANKEQMRYAMVVISIYFYSRVVAGKSNEFVFVS